MAISESKNPKIQSGVEPPHSKEAGPPLRPRSPRRLFFGAARPYHWAALTGLVCAALVIAHLTRALYRDSPAPNTNGKRSSGRTIHVPLDARLGYQGPFTNVHPAVKYVGSAACGKCHADIAKSYAHHPMARTLIPIARLAPSQPYDHLHRNPFVAFESLFKVDRMGTRVWHRQTAPADGEPVYQFDTEVHYAIGSGSHGHSYLSNRDGYLFQTPVSWFSQKQIWDRSPGFSADSISGRPIAGPCLFCHSNRAQSLDNQVNRYASPIFPTGHGIGCERCHGPGEKHIANPGSRVPVVTSRVGRALLGERTRNASGEGGKPGLEVDPTIVHPGKLKKLDPELCESICRQCHLTGEQRIVRHGRSLYDYRPGLPLDSFLSIFVLVHKGDESWRAVNHVEQMHLSRCFQGSRGADLPAQSKLGCISCHDPHVHIGPDRRVDFYRQRCLACHTDAEKHVALTPRRSLGCSLPLARRKSDNSNSCIDCHMTRYVAADIVHNASTDHRILSKPSKEHTTSAEGRLAGALAGASLVPFLPASYPKGSVDPKDRELARDLGLALASGNPSPHSAALAIPLLEVALQNDPDDIEVWEKKGLAFLMQGSQGQALAAFQTALAKDRNRELALFMAAKTAYNLGERQAAATFFGRARQLNPWNPGYRSGLAAVLADKGAWEEACRECQAWLQLEPASIAARKFWIGCLLRTGQDHEARAELGRTLALHPKNAEQLKSWFAALAPSK